MLAIVDAYRAGLLTVKNSGTNLLAGLIVAVIAVPLAMAFAIASGVKPEQGLYTAVIAGLAVSLFGGSRVQIAGPTGAFIVILASITAQYGVSGLQMASLMAGVILLFMGFVKLGSVIKFIPEPVIVGFTAGIGVIIFVGEWKDFFGLSVNLPLDASFYQKITQLFTALPQLHPATTALGLLSLLLVLVKSRFLKYLPGPLLAMVVVTVVQALCHFDEIATIGSAFGGIPQQLPQLHFPEFSFSRSMDLIGPAFTIALLGAIESLLSAAAADGMLGTRHNSNQELIGQGIANIIAPFFGGFAATGAIARTATNIRYGGNSPIAGIVHSIALLLMIALFAPLAADIPLCTLAAILFVVAYNMSDIPHFIRTVQHAPKYDVLVLIITFLLTVMTNLIVAVNVGVILSVLFFVRRMHQSVIVEEQTSETLQTELATSGLSSLPQGTIVYSIQGPFFFGVAEKVEHALDVTHTDPKNIIFRLQAVPFMDMTGLETFSEVIERYHQRGVHIYLCEANTRVRRKLNKAGILQWVTDKRVFGSFSDVVKKLATRPIERRSGASPDNL